MLSQIFNLEFIWPFLNDETSALDQDRGLTFEVMNRSYIFK